MKQVRTRHSIEFKIKALELCNQHGKVGELSRELGINPETLSLWRKKYREGTLVLKSGVVEKQKSKEELELSRLRKELYEVTQERDILKKAVSIFSKSGR